MCPDIRFGPRQSARAVIPTMALNILQWKPCYTLEHGLDRTIDYVQQHLKHYKPYLINR